GGLAMAGGLPDGGADGRGAPGRDALRGHLRRPGDGLGPRGAGGATGGQGRYRSGGPGTHRGGRAQTAGRHGREGRGRGRRLGDLGEIQVRGSVPLPGYWRGPEATSQVTTADGFHRTGDVGVLDADGYLTIVDRLTDMIISGGENVYPSEVEAVLAGHPAVADGAGIGIPDQRGGETGHAAVGGPPRPDAAELI